MNGLFALSATPLAQNRKFACGESVAPLATISLKAPTAKGCTEGSLRLIPTPRSPTLDCRCDHSLPSRFHGDVLHRHDLSRPVSQPVEREQALGKAVHHPCRRIR